MHNKHLPNQKKSTTESKKTLKEAPNSIKIIPTKGFWDLFSKAPQKHAGLSKFKKQNQKIQNPPKNKNIKT